jgi:hypothetical protein
VTSDQIRTEIDKLRTLANRDQFNPALWMPLWEIAFQLARQNEIRLFELGLDETPEISGTANARPPKTEPGTPEATKQ